MRRLNSSGENDSIREPLDDILSDIAGQTAPPEVHERMEAHFDAARLRLEALRQRPRRSAVRRVLADRRVLGIASVAAALAMVVLMLLPQGLYAQAVKALRSVRTVHVIGHSLQNGEWRERSEIWYDRDAGFTVRETTGGQTRMRISDGHAVWDYYSSSNRAFPRRRRGEEEDKILRTQLSLESLRQWRELKPVGERNVDGHACNVYSHEPAGGGVRMRMEICLDREHKIVRRWEKFRPLVNGGWEKYETAAMTYDVPIARERFDVRAIPNVVVAGNSEPPKGTFNFSTFVFQKELVGCLYTVHDLRRLDNGWVYVVSSIRPTTETLKQLGPRDPAADRRIGHDLCSFQVDSSWKRLPDGSVRLYQPATLAEAGLEHGEVRWDLLIPKGSWGLDGEDVVDLSANVYARNELEQWREKKGLPGYGRFRLGELSISRKATLEDAMADAFGSAAALEPTARSVGVHMSDENRPWTHGKEHGEWQTNVKKPGDTSFEEFQAEAAGRLQALAGRD